MIEEFKKGGFTLYAGRWPIAPAVGPIRSDGSVLDEKGVLRFQVIDDELYAANSLLVGKIDSVGKEWIVADEKQHPVFVQTRYWIVISSWSMPGRWRGGAQAITDSAMVSSPPRAMPACRSTLLPASIPAIWAFRSSSTALPFLDFPIS